MRAISSAGSEHLVYTEGVGGSNPSSPTRYKNRSYCFGFFVMDHFVYILYSAKLDRYYVGSSEDVGIRLKEHLWEHKGFTSKAKDWELKYSERLGTKTEAINRERQIKRWKSRKLLEKLIISQK